MSSLSKPIELYRVGLLVLCDRLTGALRHDEVGREDAPQVRIGGDKVGHDVEAGRCLTVRHLVRDQFEAGILGRDLLLEALGALIERADSRQRGDERDVALGLPVFLHDPLGQTVGGDTPALDVVGCEERGEGLRVGGRIDADDRHFLRGLIDRLTERLELCGRDDDRRGLLGDGVLEDRNLAGDVRIPIALRAPGP